MSARSWIIGSAPQCDIRIQSSTVSGTHCRLTERGESFLLEDLQSSNGVFVAGERIAGQRIVRRGEQVTLGQSVPLPWPASITIGRLPDNHVVIPLETVSGHHACLERDEDRVYLIDLGSTNGTAINDPLNKISRASLQPDDFVFFGAHRMSAMDLFAALPPEPARLATALEQPRPIELVQAALPPGDIEEAVPVAVVPPPPSAPHSLGSWLGGIAISVAAAIVIFGAAHLLQSPRATPASNAATTPAESPASAPHASPPVVPVVPAPRQVPPAMPAPPDEKIVRRSEAGVALVGVRMSDKLIFTKALTTTWACGRSEVICPTAILERLSSKLKEIESNDKSLIVCTPSGSIAILDYRNGAGDAAGFSVATLESPLEMACVTRTTPADFTPLPGQKLAVLVGQSKNDDPQAVSDDPQTITRQFAYLTINRINRSDDDKLPLMIICAADDKLGAASGAPVFDASGAVVGCVQSADDQSRTVEVVPLTRLKSLLSSGN